MNQVLPTIGVSRFDSNKIDGGVEGDHNFSMLHCMAAQAFLCRGQKSLQIDKLRSRRIGMTRHEYVSRRPTSRYIPYSICFLTIKKPNSTATHPEN